MELCLVHTKLASALQVMSEDDLVSFAASHQGPERNGEIEVYIYTCLLLFGKFASLRHLEAAFQLAEAWAATAVPDNPDRGRRFDILSTILALSRRPGEPSSDELDIPTRSLHMQAMKLLDSFDETGRQEILDEAVEVMEKAIAIRGGHVPPRIWSDFEAILGTRFESTGSIDDLDRVVDAAKCAVDATFKDDPELASYANNLGVWLGIRFERTGSIDDIDRAVDAAVMAVETTPEGHADLGDYQSNLGNWTWKRFEKAGNLQDLDQAIGAATKVLESMPQDNANYISYSSSLGNRLGKRFDRTGVKEDLDRAIDAATRVMESISENHPGLATGASNLGSWLGKRFERTGSVEDLDRAIEALTKAVESALEGDIDHAIDSSNLGLWLGMRFSRTGSMNDLAHAIEHGRRAVDHIPEDHVDYAAYSNNFGVWLRKRFDKLGSMEDLEQAIASTTRAVKLTPQDHTDIPIFLQNLGNLFGARFSRTGAMADLDRAIENMTQALESTPPEHPSITSRCIDFGNWLGGRFERTGAVDDQDQQLSLYEKGWASENAPPYLRVRAAWRASEIYLLRQNWPHASSLLSDAILLLPIVSLQPLDDTDKSRALSELQGLASIAASVALNAGHSPVDALRLLDFGRTIMTGLMMNMHLYISDLSQAHPDLAEKFTSLRSQIHLLEDSELSLALAREASSSEWQQQQRIKANQELDELLDHIRGYPNFATFLQPPTAEDLMSAAKHGPIVVVNVSSYRCDAFIIQTNSIRAVELPDLTLSDVVSWQAGIRAGSEPALLLEWLWRTVCRPCMDALGFTEAPADDHFPRMWWVPTGFLGLLPLHAAGIHETGSTESVLERVMSSYTTSVQTLLYARQRHTKMPPPDTSRSALLVCMDKTPDRADLPFATNEADMLRNLCPALHLNAVLPPQIRPDVLTHLQDCSIFHFAGHSLSYLTEPSRSCLLLEDWKSQSLTVEHLRDIQLQRNTPFVAFVSAGSQLVGADASQSEEVVHLPSVLHLLGFQHAIGTLWEVSDEHGVDVSRVVYETLRDEGMTDLAVCQGLHRALRMLRDSANIQEARDVKLASDGSKRRRIGNGNIGWIPYAHFGV